MREFWRKTFRENDDFGCLLLMLASILLVGGGLFILINSEVIKP
jgi:hypothetical protein